MCCKARTLKMKLELRQAERACAHPGLPLAMPLDTS